MLALPLYVVFAGMTVWGFFRPGPASITFISVAAVFALWLLAGNFALRSKTIRNLDLNAMSAAELALFRKYAIYFLYPYSAQQYSSTFSLIQALSIVWVALLSWHHEWLLAGCFVGVFFGATNMAPFIHPGTFLRHHSSRGNLPDFLEERLQLLQAVEQKVLQARGLA